MCADDVCCFDGRHYAFLILYSSTFTISKAIFLSVPRDVFGALRYFGHRFVIRRLYTRAFFHYELRGFNEVVTIWYLVNSQVNVCGRVTIFWLFTGREGLVRSFFVCSDAIRYVACASSTYFNVVGGVYPFACVSGLVGMDITGANPYFGSQSFYVITCGVSGIAASSKSGRVSVACYV